MSIYEWSLTELMAAMPLNLKRGAEPSYQPLNKATK